MKTSKAVIEALLIVGVSIFNFIMLGFILSFVIYGNAYGESPKIYTNDGTYLGNMSANIYDPNSVNNPYGIYGNSVNPNSIKNTMGIYGNQYSPQSVNNPYSFSEIKVKENHINDDEF